MHLRFVAQGTLYSRFQRWVAKGVWANLLCPLATASGPPVELPGTLCGGGIPMCFRRTRRSKAKQSGARLVAALRNPYSNQLALAASHFSSYQRRSRRADTLPMKSAQSSWSTATSDTTPTPCAGKSKLRGWRPRSCASEKLLIPLLLQKPECHRADVKSPQRCSSKCCPL
jgi:hypothetical protein